MLIPDEDHDEDEDGVLAHRISDWTKANVLCSLMSFTSFLVLLIKTRDEISGLRGASRQRSLRFRVLPLFENTIGDLIASDVRAHVREEAKRHNRRWSRRIFFFF